MGYGRMEGCMVDAEDKRYVLRLPPELYITLNKMAQADSRSLNNYITLLLKKAVAHQGMGQGESGAADGHQERAA
jgi:hypothetical protein